MYDPAFYAVSSVGAELKIKEEATRSLAMTSTMLFCRVKNTLALLASVCRRYNSTCSLIFVICWGNNLQSDHYAPKPVADSFNAYERFRGTLMQGLMQVPFGSVGHSSE